MRPDVVMALNYYAPYVSGLTEAARMVAEALAADGVKVTVVACRHDPALPARETIAGVDVIRTKVTARLGKAVLSPSFAATVARVSRDARVLNLHLPLPDAGAIAVLARHRRLVLTYQCDADRGSTAASRVQARLLDASHQVAMMRASVLVASSEDYARSSRLASQLTSVRGRPISPPTRQRSGLPRFRQGSGLHVGFLGRLVEEKGLPHLVAGFSALRDPDARLLIAGDPERVAGGSVIHRLNAEIDADPRIRLMGFLDDADLGDFYASLDVFAFPSVNSFEAFGIAQVEAMRAGVPSLASDLPGVRTPVQSTGFGVIVPPRDDAAITRALSRIPSTWHDPIWRSRGASDTSARYSLERTVEQYRAVFFGATAG